SRSVSERVGIRRGQDLRALGTCRAVASVARIVTLMQGLPILLGEALESGFGVLIDSANGRDQAGVKERLHAFAELIRGARGGAGHVGFESLASGLAGSAVFGVQRRKG